MLRDNANALSIVFRFVDLLIVYLSSIVAYYYSAAHSYYTSHGMFSIPNQYLIVVLIAILLTIFIYPIFSIYRVWRGTSIMEEVKQLSLAWLFVGLSMSFIALFTKTGAEFSRSWVGLWFIIGWLMFICSRLLLRVVLRWIRARGFNQRHIVIVGTGIHAVKIANSLERSNWFGLEINAFFGPVTEFTSVNMKSKIASSDYRDVIDYISKNQIDQVWIALSHEEEDTIRKIIDDLRNNSIEIKYVPDIFEFQIMQHNMTSVAGLPVVNISHSPMIGLNKNLKTIEDYVFASLALIFVAPLMLVIALLIKLTSKGPIIYRQTRVSWNNQPFTMLKFRSMPVDAEADTGPVWAREGEARATWLGAFLRKTSLDELPQLINVLRGEMSLVGPRPERPVFIEKYKQEIPDYMRKHLVKAGLTGWAQINGWRGNTSLKTRIEHDLYYIEHWSIWFDVKILLLTLLKGFINKNAY